MRSHTPANTASAIRYVLHPDSLSAHQATESPASQVTALQAKPWYADHRSDLLRHDPAPVPEVPVLSLPVPSWHRSYRNHDLSEGPAMCRPPPSFP